MFLIILWCTRRTDLYPPYLPFLKQHLASPNEPDWIDRSMDTDGRDLEKVAAHPSQNYF